MRQLEMFDSTAPTLRVHTSEAHPLRLARERLLWTQSKLARMSRVSLRTICSIEKGYPAQMDTKRKIMSALDIDFRLHPQLFPTSQKR